ncbi:hypothetical protein Tco_1030482 [Tanacetum coccineum]|uniref:Reverse transcriptase domain-containing protein n=1 Tax=Tanacetum coccineum TaxID=301880 RepID=A0ABQ5G6M4_9ASTR
MAEMPPYLFIFFADDSLFFLKASHIECGTLVSILNSYCEVSGQTVNFQKSSAFFSPNTPYSLRNDICGDLHSASKNERLEAETSFAIRYVQYAIVVKNQSSIYFLNVHGLVRFGLALLYPSDLLNQAYSVMSLVIDVVPYLLSKPRSLRYTLLASLYLIMDGLLQLWNLTPK